MTRPVHVIAVFNMAGKVMPLYVRLSLEPDAPTYRVRVLESRDRRMAGYMATYYCVVERGTTRQEIRLLYHGSTQVWYLMMSNSRGSFLEL